MRWITFINASQQQKGYDQEGFAYQSPSSLMKRCLPHFDPLIVQRTFVPWGLQRKTKHEMHNRNDVT